MGPDYTAEDLHRLAEIGRDTLAQAGYGRPFSDLPLGQALEIGELLKLQLKQNRYQRETGILTFTAAEEASHRIQAAEWRNYFHTLEWLRIVADMTFLLAGVLPLFLGVMRLVLAREENRP